MDSAKLRPFPRTVVVQSPSFRRSLPGDGALRGLTRLPWISGAFCRKFAGSPVCPRFSQRDKLARSPSVIVVSPMSEHSKFLLLDSQIPDVWVNVLPSLPEPMEIGRASSRE